ncbi:hypothetical protein JTB14_012968 [Gonioctena quinquepunctata]|nr:hypothetical protein JTB14_012968 [Gonioctena quinquepunctata]
MRNIKSGFAKTGLWPPDRLVFSEADFAASSVTDRPVESTSVDISGTDLAFNPEQPSTSGQNKCVETPENLNMQSTSSNFSVNDLVSPEENYFEPDELPACGQSHSYKNTRGPKLEELFSCPKADITRKRSRKRKAKCYQRKYRTREDKKKRGK